MRRDVRLFYYRERSFPRNFGDALSPIIVERLSGRRVTWAPDYRCDVIAIGSLLDGVSRRRWQRRMARPFASALVWGTGTIRPGGQLSQRGLACVAVRGNHTRQRLNLCPSVALGDPGLLVRDLFPQQARSTYRWAIVPHLTDRHHPAVQRMAEATPRSIVVHLDDEPESVISQIARSDFVLSTSLHGIVTANAFGKPFLWARLHGRVAGETWKFDDYASAFNDQPFVQHDVACASDLRAVEHQVRALDQAAVNRVTGALHAAFAATGFGRSAA